MFLSAAREADRVGGGGPIGLPNNRREKLRSFNRGSQNPTPGQAGLKPSRCCRRTREKAQPHLKVPLELACGNSSSDLFSLREAENKEVKEKKNPLDFSILANSRVHTSQPKCLERRKCPSKELAEPEPRAAA